MKIAAILESDMIAGGGFNQALNAVNQMSRLCEGKYEFAVYTSRKTNIEYLNRLGHKAYYLKHGLVGKWLSFSATNRLLGNIQSRLKIIAPFEKRLLSEAVDLVYFVEPNSRCLALQELNYITTVWDLCHREFPEFPEVRSYNCFLSREYVYSNTLSQALLVLCDSEESKNRIARYYCVDSERLLAMPFSPSPFLEEEYSDAVPDVLTKYQLTPGYLFYPAQFWAHKNHVRILEAIKGLRDNGIIMEAVFCGGDHGNLEYVKRMVAGFELQDIVHFLGFVPAEEMRGLYEYCAAVVMPTYFGPTNLPPLEAWKLGKPLIYSAHLSDQAGNAAILVDADSVEDLTNALRMVAEGENMEEMIQMGRTRLAEVCEARQLAEIALSEHLRTFSKRLMCWSS